MAEYIGLEVGTLLLNAGIAAESAALIEAGTFLFVNAAAVGSTAILVGGMALSASQARKAKRQARDAYNANQVDRLENSRATVAPRELVLGRVRKGGTVFYEASTGPNKTTYVMLVALAAHEIDAVEGIYLNNELVTLDGAGNVQQAPYALTSTASGYDTGGVLTHTPIAGSDRYFTGSTGGREGDMNEVSSGAAWTSATYQYVVTTYNANIRAVLGTAGQAADARLQALFPGVWTADHKASGIAYLICEFTYDETSFPTGLPTVTALIRGAKCYDPRENRYLHSGDMLNAAWTRNTLTPPAGPTIVAPDGTTTAYSFTGAGADSYLLQFLTIGSLTAWTQSVWLKAPTPITISLCARQYPSATDTTDTAIAVTTSWQRFTLSGTTVSGTTSMHAAIGGFGGIGVGEVIHIWHPQFEARSRAYAYAPTTSAAITPITAWTQNPALQMRHVYQHAKFGKATYISAEEDDRIITAANACDSSTGYVVGGVTTTAALYRSGLVAQWGTAAKDLFEDLSQAMAGSWAFAGGELYLKAGVHTPSVMSLVDADLAVVVRSSGGQDNMRPISVSSHKERANIFNTVNAQIWDQEQDYLQVALTPVSDSALVTRDGATLTQAVTMAAVSYAPQAQHVAAIMTRDARDPMVVELPLKLRAYPVELFDVVDVTLSRYGWTNKLFLVLGRELTAEGALKLTLKETAASIYTLGASFLAQGGADNTLLPSPWYVAPVGALTVTSGTSELTKQADGTVVSKMRVAWPALTDAGVLANGSIEVQYRSVIDPDTWTSVVVDGNQTQVVISDVQDSNIYTVRVRARTRQGVSDWNAQVVHAVVGKTQPPPAFDFFLVLVQPDGTRQYNFGYDTTDAQPVDWLGGEIRYVSGTVGSPDWATMTRLQDLTSYYTHSPVELNSPLAGTYTFAVKSLDTSGNESAYLVQTITLPDRRLGNVFAEYFEGPDGWLGTKTGFQVQDAILQATDSTTWATAPATWAGFTRWNYAPTSPAYYETPAKDFGTSVAGQINSTIDADGTQVLELATSADGATWSGWSTATAPFSTRYIKLRLTITATGPSPVPVVRQFDWQVNAPIRSEYLNDIVISSLAGSYRIGTGDIRIPLAGSYTVLKKTDVVIQDSTAGAWVATRIDQTLTFGPRWQFRLNGTLTDPAFVDFYVEGY